MGESSTFGWGFRRFGGLTNRAPRHGRSRGFKTHLSEFVDLASAGLEITISKSGKPKARLVPLDRGHGRNLRIPGKGNGSRIAHDFDAPLPADVLKLFGESPA